MSVDIDSLLLYSNFMCVCVHSLRFLLFIAYYFYLHILPLGLYDE